MSFLRQIAIAGLLILITASATHAECNTISDLATGIHVRVTPIGPDPEPCDYLYSAGSNISINVDNSTSLVNIWAIPTSANIGLVSIGGSGTNLVSVQFGAGAYRIGDLLPSGVCGSLGGISCSRSNVRLNGGIHGDLTSSISGLRVDAFLTEGAMLAGITSTGTGSTPVIEAGSTQSIALIRNDSGGLQSVTIFGNGAGDIEAASDTIGTVAIGGNYSGTINSAGTIGNVTISGSLLNDGDSGIIASASIGALTINSNAQAPIQASTITGRANIKGNLGSSITLSSTVPNTGHLVIGGSLLSTGSIVNPAIAGRVVINENHAGGLWTGPVTVGGNTLAPNYTNTALSIGGGCAGIVPFDLHGTDSSPVDGALIPYASRPTAANPIRIRLYGALRFTSGQIPVTITAQSLHSGGEIDQNTILSSACIANVARDPFNPSILVITPPAATNYEFLSGYTYRIRPVRAGAAVLNCDIASPVPVADWEYSFCVGTSDSADINGDGSINTSDFNILASHWAHIGCPIGGDVDGDGKVNISDFNVVAGIFETDVVGGCNPASLMRNGGGEGEEMNQLEAVVEKMGFESLSDFSAWLEELPEKDQLDVLMELIARIGE